MACYGVNMRYGHLINALEDYLSYGRENIPDPIKAAVKAVKTACMNQKYKDWKSYAFSLVPTMCMKWDYDSWGYFTRRSDKVRALNMAIDEGYSIGLILEVKNRETGGGMTAGYDHNPDREYWIDVTERND